MGAHSCNPSIQETKPEWQWLQCSLGYIYSKFKGSQSYISRHSQKIKNKTIYIYYQFYAVALFVIYTTDVFPGYWALNHRLSHWAATTTLCHVLFWVRISKLPRLGSDLWCSCLNLPECYILGVCYYAESPYWLILYQPLNLSMVSIT